MKNWTPSDTVMATLTHKFDFILSFNKENDGVWYVDIPYPLSHGNLAMIAGADKFLESLAKGSRRVTVRFCDRAFEGYGHLWTKTDNKEAYGCTYNVDSPDYDGKAWLCPVTLYVLGHYPKSIYIEQIA